MLRFFCVALLFGLSLNIPAQHVAAAPNNAPAVADGKLPLTPPDGWTEKKTGGKTVLMVFAATSTW